MVDDRRAARSPGLLGGDTHRTDVQQGSPVHAQVISSTAHAISERFGRGPTGAI